MRLLHKLPILALALICVLQAQVSLTTPGTAYTQNFDSLASSGTANTVLPTGWALLETGTSALNNSAYSGGTGSSNAGDVYSFGTNAADRAFGGLLSGTLTPTIGASFVNNTGGPSLLSSFPTPVNSGESATPPRPAPIVSTSNTPLMPRPLPRAPGLTSIRWTSTAPSARPPPLPPWTATPPPIAR